MINNVTAAAASIKYRCLEWFSGIGGLHYALLDAGIPSIEVVASFDINQLANSVYLANFNKSPITKNIEHFTKEYVEKFHANVWLLSPPCQPYTQGGKQRDDKDPRSAGLLHLIQLLSELQSPPEYLFLENVPFFEVSNCHALLLNVLKKRSYEIEEYLVAPTDPLISIPNRRKRYYLSARLVRLDIPSNHHPPFISDRIIFNLMDVIHPSSVIPISRKLASYLELLQDDDDISPFLVPLDFIQSAKDFKFDIVTHQSESCATFTKAYGSKYVIGTGSLLQTRSFHLLHYSPDDQSVLPLLGLRFFTPSEISDLHAFPHATNNSNPKKGNFSFPTHLNLSLLQKYRLLGNSLNIRVVSVLLQRLFNYYELDHL